MNYLLPSVNQHIKIIIDTKFKGNVTDFAKALGYNGSQKINRLFKPDTRNGKYPTPSTDILTDISNKFDISIDALISGTNEINNRETTINNQSNDLGPIEYPTLDSHNQFIDLKDGKILMIITKVEEPAYAGYLSNFADPQFIDALPFHSIIVDKYHKGNYRAFEIVGDSMDDGSKESIPDGSIATGREIYRDYWKSKFHTHRYKDYIIVSNTEGIIAKRIIAHDVPGGMITCHSLNTDKTTYPDLELSLEDVKQIFNIVNVSIAR
jgi:hypothetical protein